MPFKIIGEHKTKKNINIQCGVQRAPDVLYMQRLSRGLGVLGAWPDHTRGGLQATRRGRVRRVLLALYALAVMPTHWFAAQQFEGREARDVRRFGHILLTFMLNCVGLSKCLLFFSEKYWELTDKFMDDIHLFNHKHRNEHFLKLHGVVHGRCHTLWAGLIALLVGGVVAYNLRPLYVNVASGMYTAAPEDRDYEYSVYVDLPGLDFRRDLAPHIACMFWGVMMSWWCVTVLWLPDLLAMMVVLHIWGHMRVLGLEMKQFSEETEEGARNKGQLDEQQSAAARDKLDYFITSHRQVLSNVKATSETFSSVYFVYFIYFQVSLCIMMWECSQGIEGLVQYGLLTASSVFSLSLLCIVMEMIATENDSLEVAVYCLPWQLLRVPEMRTMLIMLMRVQEPLRMKALGMTDIGVSTMAGILKTSTSYFMLLRSME